MAVLSERNSVLAARKIKKMIKQSTTREQLTTVRRYFELFRNMTMITGIAEDIEEQFKQHEEKLFPEHGQ